MTRKSAWLMVMTLILAAALPAQAYTYKFSNGMPPGQGVGVKFTYAMPTSPVTHKWHDVNSGNGIQPGQSWQKTHTGGEAGNCLVGVEYKIKKELPGCESGNLSGNWYHKEGIWCGNKEIVVYRDGCTLKFNIRRLPK